MCARCIHSNNNNEVKYKEKQKNARKAFQVKTLPANRPTGLDPLPHMIGKFPAATNEQYMCTDILAQVVETDLAALVITHQVQAAAARCNIDGDDLESRTDLL